MVSPIKYPVMPPITTANATPLKPKNEQLLYDAYNRYMNFPSEFINYLLSIPTTSNRFFQSKGLEFIKDFILSGFIVSVSALLIRDNQHQLSGFLYGSLPIGFLYLLLTINTSRDKTIEFSKETYIGGIFFFLYTFIVYLLFKFTQLSVFWIVLIATILFTFAIYASRKHMLYKRF